MANTNDKRTVENFGRNLRRLRIEKGFTIEDFAWEIQVSTRLIYDYENGFKKPKVETFVLIGKVLGVSLDDMLR